LDQILKQTRFDGGKPCEVKKIEEIYFKSTIDSNNSAWSNSSSFSSLGLHRIKLIWQRWVTTPQPDTLLQTKEHKLQFIQFKIKDAVQKSIELAPISTSVAVTKLRILQHFNTDGTWLEDEAKVKVKPPNPPQLCIKEITVNKSVILTWSRKDDDDDDIYFFELCYDEEQHLSIPLNGSINTTEVGFPKVVPGKIYIMKICGINEGGEGNWSNSVVVKFTKPPPCKPDPPEICMVDASTAMLTVIPPRLSCEKESPVTEWNVQYAIDGQSLEKRWITENYKVISGERKQTFDVKSLDPNKKYHFQVQARNAEGESDFSKPVCITTVFNPPLDPPKKEAVGTSKAKFAIRVPKWPSPVTEWKIQCVIHEPPKRITHKVQPEEEMCTFNLEDLIPNQTYNIQVEAINAEGYSAVSPIVSFKTENVNSLPMPLSISVMLASLFLYHLCNHYMYEYAHVCI